MRFYVNKRLRLVVRLFLRKGFGVNAQSKKTFCKKVRQLIASFRRILCNQFLKTKLFCNERTKCKSRFVFTSKIDKIVFVNAGVYNLNMAVAYR